MRNDPRKTIKPTSSSPPPMESPEELSNEHLIEANAPLEIEEDEVDDRAGYAIGRPQRGPSMEPGAHHELNRPEPPEDVEDDFDFEIEAEVSIDSAMETMIEPAQLARAQNSETSIELRAPVTIDRALMGNEAGHMSDMLNWALDSIHEPSIAAADWLARDIDPEQPTATSLLSDPTITLVKVKQAKSVFKTMRIVGEKSADRRIGARMYAAAIAAGLVRHRTLVSRQSNEALNRGFQGLLDDHRMPSQLRDLAGMALCVLKEKRFRLDAFDDGSPRPHRQPPRPSPQSRGNGKAGGRAAGKAGGGGNGKPRRK